MTDDLRRRFAPVLDLIEARLAHPPAMGELARAAGYSPWHFQRVWLAVVGEPAASYVRRRRLTEAARALAGAPRRRVLDVALDHGFESHEAFSRAFRALAGRTPSEFRRTPAAAACTWMRPPLRVEALRLIPMDLKQEPTLLDLPALSLVGLSARFIAAMSPDATNMEVIPPLWGRLLARRAEFAVAPDALTYGACRGLPPADRTRDDELDYLAGWELRPGAPVPPGAVTWQVPAQRYACFTHRGPVQAFATTLNYVWGSWFPRSEFEPAGGAVELERYDHRFHPHREDSELDYLVPIVAKRG